MKKYLLAILLFILSAGFHVHAEEKKLRVVASFSILGDMVKKIGGDVVDLTILAGPDADMHNFRPMPKNAIALADADIIVINGLGLEGWLHRLIEASGTRAKLLVASAGIKPRVYNHDGKPFADPHAWQSPSNGRIYVRNIAGALINAMSEHAVEIKERAERYDDELKKLDKWAQEQFASIPENRRKVVTTHDAFGYFGDAYGITFLSPLGVRGEGGASAMNISKLIEQIKTEGVRAVFIENMTDPRLMERIARDTGVHIGGKLYSDSLSTPDGPASTYVDMLRYNVVLIREAMGSD